MAKNYYAVKRGFDKETQKEVNDLIFTEWDSVKPLVTKYDNARYKGFDTEEEAKVWLSVVDKTDAEKRSKETLDSIKKDIGITMDPTGWTLEEIINSFKMQGMSKELVIGTLTAKVVETVNKLY